MTTEVLVILLGLIIIIAAVIVNRAENRLADIAEEVTATVVGFDRSQSPAVPLVEFTVDKDIVKLGLLDYTDQKLQVGDEVQIEYAVDIQAGKRVYKAVPRETGLPASKLVLTLMVVGAWFVLFGLVLTFKSISA